MRILILALLILALLTPALAVPNFKIVEEKDISIKALDKPLSSYSMQELNKIPMNRRMRYKIVIEPGLWQEECTKIINDFISSVTTNDKDIDEIALFVYDNKDTVDYVFNVASVRWCPKDGWDKVTPYIALSNSRTNYAISIEWSDGYEDKVTGLVKYIKKEESGVMSDIDVKINITIENVENKLPVITGTTNLPDETQLMITVIEVDRLHYRGQDKVMVKDGSFRSAQFSNRGRIFSDGEYLAEVTMPIAEVQPERVQAIIGAEGEYLKGALVKENSIGAHEVRVVEASKRFKIGR